MHKLLRSLFRYVGNATPSGLPVPIASGPLRGYCWLSRAAGGAGGGLSVCANLSEPSQLAAARKLADRASICFDVGANVGLYTLLFARYCRSVVAFEPLPRNLMWLYRALAHNHIQNATIVPCAVSDGMALSAFQPGDNCGVGKLARDGTQPVACVSLDEFCTRFSIWPSIIKIDVEGAEAAVLRGARQILAEHGPSLLLSTHGDAVKDECLAYLAALEYRAEPLNAATVADASEFCLKKMLPAGTPGSGCVRTASSEQATELAPIA